MNEYQMNMTQAPPAAANPTHQPSQPRSSPRTLLSHFNLPTMEMQQQESGCCRPQTVEQELTSYLAIEVALKTDQLLFWQVSNHC